MNIGSRVNTPHGPGEIKAKDICTDNRETPEEVQVWTGRWGVLHDVYPEDNPVGAYRDNILYYQEEELEES